MSLLCFHIAGLSMADAFEPVMNIEHEATLGGFKCLYWLLKHIRKDTWPNNFSGGNPEA